PAERSWCAGLGCRLLRPEDAPAVGLAGGERARRREPGAVVDVGLLDGLEQLTGVPVDDGVAQRRAEPSRRRPPSSCKFTGGVDMGRVWMPCAVLTTARTLLEGSPSRRDHGAQP